MPRICQDWMIGKFKGYNMKYGSEVELDISEEGACESHR